MTRNNAKLRYMILCIPTYLLQTHYMQHHLPLSGTPESVTCHKALLSVTPREINFNLYYIVIHAGHNDEDNIPVCTSVKAMTYQSTSLQTFATDSTTLHVLPNVYLKTEEIEQSTIAQATTLQDSKNYDVSRSTPHSNSEESYASQEPYNHNGQSM